MTDDTRVVAMTRQQRDALYGKSIVGHQLAEAYDGAYIPRFLFWICPACGDTVLVGIGHASESTCNGFNRYNQHAPTPMIKHIVVPVD